MSPHSASSISLTHPLRGCPLRGCPQSLQRLGTFGAEDPVAPDVDGTDRACCSAIVLSCFSAKEKIQQLKFKLLEVRYKY